MAVVVRGEPGRPPVTRCVGPLAGRVGLIGGLGAGPGFMNWCGRYGLYKSVIVVMVKRRRMYIWLDVASVDVRATV